jgi:hypothetical protein
MPFNGDGVFVRLYNWTVDASNSATNYVRADKMDAEMNGFATGLSNCMTRDGEAPPLANLPMGNYKFTGLGQGAVAGDSLSWDQIFSGTVTLSATYNVTGALTVPTQAYGTSSTLAASTAFVATNYAPLASPALTGTPTAPTAPVGANTNQLATMAALQQQAFAGVLPAQSAGTAGQFPQSQGASGVVVWASPPTIPDFLLQTQGIR